MEKTAKDKTKATKQQKTIKWWYCQWTEPVQSGPESDEQPLK